MTIFDGVVRVVVVILVKLFVVCFNCRTVITGLVLLKSTFKYVLVLKRTGPFGPVNIHGPVLDLN